MSRLNSVNIFVKISWFKSSKKRTSGTRQPTISKKGAKNNQNINHHIKIIALIPHVSSNEKNFELNEGKQTFYMKFSHGLKKNLQSFPWKG